LRLRAWFVLGVGAAARCNERKKDGRGGPSPPTIQRINKSIHAHLDATYTHTRGGRMHLQERAGIGEAKNLSRDEEAL
jgi:hypothetical protein